MIFDKYIWILIIFGIISVNIFWRFEAKRRVDSDQVLRKQLNILYGGCVFWLTLPFLVMGLGIITQSIDGVSDYFTPFNWNNWYVIGFYVLLMIEDALFVYWIFFKEGDRILALHTENIDVRPKFRMVARIFSIALPLLHGTKFLLLVRV